MVGIPVGQRSAGWLTGNDVSGHYKHNYFLFLILFSPLKIIQRGAKQPKARAEAKLQLKMGELILIVNLS